MSNPTLRKSGAEPAVPEDKGRHTANAPASELAEIARDSKAGKGGSLLQALRRGPLYSYAVDTCAAISFSVPTCMFNEVIINNMELEESIRARGMGALAAVFTARPYGKFRDFVYSKTGTTEKSGIARRAAADMVASATFSPLYSCILLASGADLKHALSGTTTALVMGALTSAPYGIFLDKARRLFGASR